MSVICDLLSRKDWRKLRSFRLFMRRRQKPLTRDRRQTASAVGWQDGNFYGKGMGKAFLQFKTMAGMSKELSEEQRLHLWTMRRYSDTRSSQGLSDTREHKGPEDNNGTRKPRGFVSTLPQQGAFKTQSTAKIQSWWKRQTSDSPPFVSE